jgi:hypothetical protein
MRGMCVCPSKSLKRAEIYLSSVDDMVEGLEIGLYTQRFHCIIRLEKDREILALG